MPYASDITQATGNDRAPALQQHSTRTRKRVKVIRAALEWLIRLRGSPKEIARGVAVGIFVALTPTVGFQIAIAACLATLLNANRSVALVGVWITNPFTVAPIFAFTYALGNKFWPGPELSGVGTTVSRAADQVAVREVWEFGAQLQTLLLMGVDVLGPLAIGGTIAGLACGTLAYFLTVPIVKHARRRKLGRMVRKAKRRAQRRAARTIARVARHGDDSSLATGTPA